MGRLSTVDDSAVFAAVGEMLSTNGTIGLQDVVKATGVSIGSLYHRYGSREELLARAWVDAVTAFQSNFRNALESGADDAGEQAALATPRFCRAERARARILMCCRKSEFVRDSTPASLKKQIDSININAAKTVAEFAKQNGYALDACHMALVAFPVGAVRLYLPDHDIPPSVDEYVVAAYKAAVAV